MAVRKPNNATLKTPQFMAMLEDSYGNYSRTAGYPTRDALFQILEQEVFTEDGGGPGWGDFSFELGQEGRVEVTILEVSAIADAQVKCAGFTITMKGE